MLSGPFFATTMLRRAAVNWRVRGPAGFSGYNNKQSRLFMRGNRRPATPVLSDRIENKRIRDLLDFEKTQEDGTLFTPVRELPPWQRYAPAVNEVMKGGIIAKNASDTRTGSSAVINRSLSGDRLALKNYRGYRVARVTGIDEPGFPTHFR